MTATTLKIDFVSDVACPWCAVGLASLQQALGRLDGEVAAELRFQPFELNPQMGPEGQDIGEHLAQKYGSTAEQQQANWEALRQRGAAVGFEFRREGRGRVWNTFDAHRLLHWAGEQPGDAQLRLKQALLRAYFTEARSVADHEVLLAAAASAGLDTQRARAILGSDEFAADVRRQQQFYAEHGIRAVPSVIVNDRHLIQGGQPPEVFEQALRQIAQEA
ncbi:MAG TPA: DsbA family oxidoreductase [Ramlibacter sp.]|jgi:predicted DsbA family dithiol-disulfide isomerase|uniref:DsbA family oxidoreductase n=1 Tax=Ramlibacter sp. TaxID=1917967 RepID=UPI002D2FE090|nr:DsbA family oxidoreductase [Ramlibacter sp.]HZY18036.1 DsbA family oxidoreductase [Ramlibacter sp.]